MMLDHLVVKKMGTRGETLLQAGELDDILRFGTEEIFAEDKKEEENGEKNADEGKEKKEEKEGEEATWDKAKYGDIPTSGGIYYDDAAVETLLDRRNKEEEVKEGVKEGGKEGELGDSRMQNEYLNSFKVASYNVDKEGKNGESFWERLLHEGYPLICFSFSLVFFRPSNFCPPSFPSALCFIYLININP